MLQGDIKAFSMADNRFHRTIVECSGNNSMLDIWDSLRMQLQVIATIGEASMPLEKLYALHPPIVASLKHKHREHAGRFLAEHYQQIATYWSTSIL